MSLLVSDRPTKNILNGNTSNWTAGHNPIVYKLKREDFQIYAVRNGLGNKCEVQVYSDLGVLEDYIRVGQRIYFYSQGVYDVQGMITQIINSNTILTDVDFIKKLSNGYLNAKQNYKVAVSLFNYSNDARLLRNDLIYTGDIKGNIEIDFQGFAKSYFTYTDNYNFDFSSFADESLSFGFYIQAVEQFKNKSPFDTFVLNDRGNYTFCTNSAKQFGDLYGQNMGDYLTFPNLYPALRNELTQPYTAYLFTYDSNSDMFIFISQDGLIQFYKYKTNYLSPQLDIGIFSATKIDAFPELNQIAISGQDLNFNATIFFDLKELVENQNAVIVWRYDHDRSISQQKKIGNLLYNSWQGGPGELYKYDLKNQTVTIGNAGYVVFDVALYNNILAMAIIDSTSPTFYGIKFYNNETLNEIGSYQLPVPAPITAVEYNKKGDLFLFTITSTLRKIKTNGDVVISNIVFNTTDVYHILINQTNGNEEKGYIRDLETIVLFDLETLDLTETYADNVIIPQTSHDFKLLNNMICTPGVNIDLFKNYFILIEIYGDKLAKFLTPFEKVPMWKDFPSDLAYIYSEKMENFQTFKRDFHYSQNGTLLQTIDTDVPISQKGNVNRITFTDIEGTCYIETQIISTGERKRQYKEQDYKQSQYK